MLQSPRIVPLSGGSRTNNMEELNYAPSCPKSPKVLRRYQSAPMVQKSPGQRRSIFGKELGFGGSQRSVKTPPPSPLQHKRAASTSMIESPQESRNMSLLSMLSRPKSETRLEERPHFCDLAHVPENLLESFPMLPTPLQRFHDGTRSQCLGGMYPLVQPDSILRHRREVSDEVSSQSSSDSSSSNGSPQARHHANHASPPIPPPTALNLTQSIRYFGSGRKLSCDSNDELSSTSSSVTNPTGRKIRFDPRVTVTEFEDDPEYRQWFSDFELDRFKRETIALAQQYLVQHPSVLEDYCKPYLDPVTGTFRKKALFSMLVLKATRADDSLDEIQSTSSEERYNKMRQELADNTFKKVLLVNHNKLVLDLFERSLAKIFPKAQFSRCENGKEALQMVNRTKRDSFDLILVEDRCHRPWKSCDGLVDGGVAAETKENQDRALMTANKNSSLGGLTKASISGSLDISEVFRIIRGLEQVEKKDQSMLIAVSTQPESNTAHLRASGADAVWGLPPPHMSDELRDELVARVLQKRRGEAPEKKDYPAFRVPCHRRAWDIM